MTTKLAGKVAVVTGGSAGIGLGITQHFAQEGARVLSTINPNWTRQSRRSAAMPQRSEAIHQILPTSTASTQP